jgi:exopolyphosphatase/guanosine-5'-triphosphate,3'-diphosphate pyrophosphatase
MQIIAAIDAGSNAMRMVIGAVDDAWHVRALDSLRLPVRLGEDVFRRGAIQEKTMQRAVDAFQHFQRVARDFGVARLRAIGTSALREATNGDILIDRISKASGIEVEAITGAEEARLIHLAVSKAINLKGKRAVLVDIGGGSVEVTISENQNILSTESYNMGTVRLLESLGSGKSSRFPWFGVKRPFPVMVREYTEAPRRRIDQELGRAKVHLCLGTGGTVEDLGRLHQRYFKNPNDKLVTLRELQELVDELGEMSLNERMRKFKLRPDRADVILPAAIVLHMIAHEARVRHVTIPHVGLKDGLLLDMAEKLSRGPVPPRRSQVWESATQLGKKYQVDADHASLTAKLAGQLFDQTESLHSLGQEERLLLEVGALLHDIGHFISTIDHDKHGYYILQANRLMGLDDRQQEMVANLVRFHRRSSPALDDPSFQNLPQKQRATVSQLSALLRLADGMDVSHAGHVKSVVLTAKKKKWRLALRGRGDLMLEKWATDKRRRLFEEVFGVALQIQDAKA